MSMVYQLQQQTESFAGETIFGVIQKNRPIFRSVKRQTGMW